MTNRKIRDTVFCRYIGTAPHLLELANALKGTQYTDTSKVNINTLEGSFYSNLKNDISFILDNMIVVLIEHQTTINPNMPLRFLSYVDEIYRMQTQSQQRKIYGKKLIKLPAPEFYVFYDGEDSSFDHEILRLSDAFLAPSDQLELTVNVYNLANNKSTKIKSLCEPLHDYSIFSNKYKQFKNEGLSIDEAIKAAIDYCLENNIMSEYLKNNEREVIDMFGFEWNEQEERKALLETGEERGRAIGIDIGKIQGKLSTLKELVLDGTLSLSKAAEKANMPVESFQKAVML